MKGLLTSLQKLGTLINENNNILLLIFLLFKLADEMMQLELPGFSMRIRKLFRIVYYGFFLLWTVNIFINEEHIIIKLFALSIAVLLAVDRIRTYRRHNTKIDANTPPSHLEHGK